MVFHSHNALYISPCALFFLEVHFAACFESFSFFAFHFILMIHLRLSSMRNLDCLRGNNLILFLFFFVMNLKQKYVLSCCSTCFVARLSVDGRVRFCLAGQINILESPKRPRNTKFMAGEAIIQSWLSMLALTCVC